MNRSACWVRGGRDARNRGRELFARAAIADARGIGGSDAKGDVRTATVAPDLAARLATELDAGLAALGSPGAQAAIVFDDGSTWVGASGTSTDDQPMTPELLMALASVTKVYTAGLVLRLADYGVLGLDDLATRWVPDAVNADGVTFGSCSRTPSGVASDDPALPPVCAPGTCYSYSNSGYGLLGRVIEAATGQQYAASLRARFLAPLGLQSTFYPREEPTVGDSAMGHLRRREPCWPSMPQRSRRAPAGEAPPAGSSRPPRTRPGSSTRCSPAVR